MDAPTHRDTVRQLAADFSWLEGHCRTRPELATHAAKLRLAAALARNVLGPAAEGVEAPPLQVAVVGGAGTGKSTLVNFLVGRVVAAANPQAGFTRHPIAFVPARWPDAIPSSLGLLGPLRRLNTEQTADLDEDVYQVRTVTPAGGADDPANEFVVWDCPDMTTWAATGYVNRLFEIIGLADVVVFVASDERYNDAVPTEFLRHVARAGKAVVGCLTKAREADLPQLVSHFQSQVLDELPGGQQSVPVVGLPQVGLDVLQDPAGAGAKYRVVLWNAILTLCPSPTEARTRTVANATKYLEVAASGLADVARQDLAAYDAWRELVIAGQSDFEARYRREFLTGEEFRRFDRTRVQVTEMLELPGTGRFLSTVLGILRLPYKYLREALSRLVARPDVPNQPEHAVCSMALAAWLDGLQAEALRRTDTHPVWRQVVRAFDDGLKTQTFDRFQQVFRKFELQESDDLDVAANAVPAALTRSGLLPLLRVGVVLLDLIVAGVTLVLIWPPSIWQLLLIPLAVGLARQVVELIVRVVVEAGRTKVRTQREDLVRTHLSEPLADSLADVPSQSGTDLNLLRQALVRIPEAVKVLAARAAVVDA